jgi:hypothetical protein
LQRKDYGRVEELSDRRDNGDVIGKSVVKTNFAAGLVSG